MRICESGLVQHTGSVERHRHAMWLYFCASLIVGDDGELLAKRGQLILELSDATIKFGRSICPAIEVRL